MSGQLAWHVARASGLVAWALAAASLLAGFVQSGRFVDRAVLPPAWLLDVHRALGGLAVVFTAVHVTALVADTYVTFTPTDVLVPFASTWRPGAVAWGIAALYLLLAVEISSLLRRRLSARWWRRLHLLSVPLFGAGTLHLVGAGTDAAHPLVSGAVLLTAGTFVALAVARIVVRPPRVTQPTARASNRR